MTTTETALQHKNVIFELHKILVSAINDIEINSKLIDYIYNESSKLGDLSLFKFDDINKSFELEFNNKPSINENDLKNIFESFMSNIVTTNYTLDIIKQYDKNNVLDNINIFDIGNITGYCITILNISTDKKTVFKINMHN